MTLGYFPTGRQILNLLKQSILDGDVDEDDLCYAIGYCGYYGGERVLHLSVMNKQGRYNNMKTTMSALNNLMDVKCGVNGFVLYDIPTKATGQTEATHNYLKSLHKKISMVKGETIDRRSLRDNSLVSIRTVDPRAYYPSMTMNRRVKSLRIKTEISYFDNDLSKEQVLSYYLNGGPDQQIKNVNIFINPYHLKERQIEHKIIREKGKSEQINQIEYISNEFILSNNRIMPFKLHTHHLQIKRKTLSCDNFLLDHKTCNDNELCSIIQGYLTPRQLGKLNLYRNHEKNNGSPYKVNRGRTKIRRNLLTPKKSRQWIKPLKRIHCSSKIKNTSIILIDVTYCQTYNQMTNTFENIVRKTKHRVRLK